MTAKTNTAGASGQAAPGVAPPAQEGAPTPRTAPAGPVQFRPSAMADTALPGQLDLGVRIVRTPHWLLLSVVLALVFAAVGFSLFIKVPIMVKAQGILIPEEGLKDIESLTTGRVKNVMVGPGDFVREGMRVVEVEQPDLSQKLLEAQDALISARKRLRQIKNFQDRIKKTDEGLMTQESKIQRHLIASNEEHIEWLRQNLASFQQLMKDGYVTSQNVNEARVKLYQTQADLIQNRNKLTSQAYKAESQNIQLEREALDQAVKVEEARAAIHSIRERRIRMGFVVSPYTGVVVEQKADLGEIVEQGQTLLSVLPGEASKSEGKLHVGLLATIYLPASEGKRVTPGMEVHVVPSTVKREEFGFIFGKVQTVAAIPASPEGMLRVLKNKQLVSTLSSEGAPLQARANLEMDPATFSGFRWSSPDGPEQHITAGSMCSVEVVVNRQQLVTLVMPAIKRLIQLVAQ